LERHFREEEKEAVAHPAAGETLSNAGSRRAGLRDTMLPDVKPKSHLIAE
jgi:hypothetical protein